MLVQSFPVSHSFICCDLFICEGFMFFLATFHLRDFVKLPFTICDSVFLLRCGFKCNNDGNKKKTKNKSEYLVEFSVTKVQVSLTLCGLVCVFFHRYPSGKFEC